MCAHFFVVPKILYSLRKDFSSLASRQFADIRFNRLFRHAVPFVENRVGAAAKFAVKNLLYQLVD